MRKNFAEYLAAATLAAAPLAAQESGDLFSKLDANKDGFVTPDEVQEGQKSLYERLLRTSDKDGDKKLSKEEFQAGLRPDEGPRPPLAGGQFPGPRGGKADPRELFNRFDANKDGKLTKDELPPREQIPENFARMDIDGDGSITPEEFAEFGRRVGQRPPGAPPQGNAAAAQRQSFEAIFDRIDSNSDGKLTKSEIPEERQMMRAVLERAGGESIGKEQFVNGMIAAMTQIGGQQPRLEGAPPRPEGQPGGPPGVPPSGGLFATLDTDRNGELSTAEIVAAGTSLLKLDRNNDGKLTPDEVFAGGMPGRPGGAPPNGNSPGAPPNGNRPGQRGFGGQNPEELMQRLKAADANNDGKLSKDEAPDFIKDRFDRIDNNSDGVIDEAELRQMVRFMSQQGGRPKAKE